MGIRRYSLDSNIRRQQERVDELERRCRIDYYAPTIGELIAAGVRQVELQCRDYECLRVSATPMDLSVFEPTLSVKVLRRKLVCSKCGVKRPEFRLLWEG